MSGTQHKQLEDQQLLNNERDLANLNGILRRKRKFIEMSLTFSHCNRKLEKAGDRSHFDAGAGG